MFDEKTKSTSAAVAAEKRSWTQARLLLIGFLAAIIIVAALCYGSFESLPGNVGRELSPDESAEVISRNSPLTDYVLLSPNADFPREGAVSKITIHHMAADLSLEDLGETFTDRDRRASSNYAIDSQGNVALYVEEANRAWTSGSFDNDSRAITIEVADDEVGGGWHVSDAAYRTLLDLCTDICRRNGIEELVYTGGPDGSLTTHKMFDAETDCPGPYLEGRMGDIASVVSERLG